VTRLVGIVCGLKSEAAAVRSVLDEGISIHIGVSGANAERAEKLAEEFCNAGAAAIISVGVSGGLEPALKPGDLIIGDRVITADGAVYASDMALLKSLLTSARGDQAICGSLFGADKIIADAEEKAALCQKHACIAVDMESHGAARAAAQAGIPFIAIRAIADPADCALPGAALGAIADDGSTRIIATLGAALRDPKQFPALVKLGRDSSAALKTLRRDLRPLFDSLLGSLFSSDL